MRNMIATLCLTLAVLLGSAGMGVSADFQKGVAAYIRGDYATALQEWKPLAERGDADAQYNLGVMFKQGNGVPQDYKQAAKWYRRAADQGNSRAQVALGEMIQTGIGVPQDYKQAAKWYRLAAEQGQASGQFNLGWLYEQGNGVPQDYKEAFKWYILAAKQMNADAQFNLGVMYAQGHGVPQDYKEAVKWYRLSAGQGDAKSQYNLGVMYAQGHGVPQDYKAAVKWYTFASKQGDAKSQYNLGVMYAQGHGVPQDDVYAHMWWNIAGSSGDKDAVRNRDIVAKRMIPSQLAKAQELARNFVPRKYFPVTAEKPPPLSKKTVPPKSGSTGSGFIVSKLGHVITNHHVVNKCRTVTVGDSAKSQVDANVLETDKRNDLALLRISSTKMASVETKSLMRKLGISVVPLASQGLLRSDDVELGEDVLVAGYPFGDIFSNTIKVTKGIVSANRGLGDDTGQFQIDAAVQPGNSGGPIYDQNGNIIGVVVAQLNKLKVAKAIGSLPENVNFGIKASTVRQFLTSSGLPSKWSSRSEKMSTQGIAQIAKNQTVMVVCHR